jgi:Ni,Fe-hydrogenase III large subunit
MKKIESNTDVRNAMGEVSSALFELRDALVELSLSLKDWQFETDLAERKRVEETVQKMIDEITSNRDRPQ